MSSAERRKESPRKTKPAKKGFDVISYYFEHRAEIERQIEENQLENILTRHNAVVDEQGRITFKDLPTHLFLN